MLEKFLPRLISIFLYLGAFIFFLAFIGSFKEDTFSKFASVILFVFFIVLIYSGQKLWKITKTSVEHSVNTNVIKQTDNLMKNRGKSNSKDNVISNENYDIVTRNIIDSKYCSISSEEEIFIKELLLKLHQNNLKSVYLQRMSTKAISIEYNGYPIGKVKLQGKRTWMQILTNLYENHCLENASLKEYTDSIDLWITYIKKFILK